ncbi:hypothetical protein TNCT_509271 [Trichonephila clavata]|uniref:Uncharacterized protein n=1 Tax=Trichonephila clavata TaxID=2740835 RepID=A0A8X6KPV5_TRICU|nr:hypothetical protein TNCT_509271 [Trichonephila clavata]
MDNVRSDTIYLTIQCLPPSPTLHFHLRICLFSPTPKVQINRLDSDEEASLSTSGSCRPSSLILSVMELNTLEALSLIL